jgi:uncharacterized membrane protein YdbT with pleckstrin-like domain
MSYIAKNLQQNERIIFQTKYFIIPIIFQCFIPYFFVFAFIPILRYRKTEFAVTNRRVVIKKGILRLHLTEISLDKITNVRLEQSMIGRMLDYGMVEFESAARDGDIKYKGVSKAKELKSAVANAFEVAQDEKIKKQAEALAAAIASKQSIA